MQHKSSALITVELLSVFFIVVFYTRDLTLWREMFVCITNPLFFSFTFGQVASHREMLRLVRNPVNGYTNKPKHSFPCGPRHASQAVMSTCLSGEEDTGGIPWSPCGNIGGHCWGPQSVGQMGVSC